MHPEYLSKSRLQAFATGPVVAAYANRAPYPEEVFDRLLGLLEPPGSVLDLGCGRGELARPLAARVSYVKAVDVSEEMVRVGKTLPGGDLPSLHWEVGRVEDLESVPYGLVVAGRSLHWLDWKVLVHLLKGSRLVIVGTHAAKRLPWSKTIKVLQRAYTSTPGDKGVLDVNLSARGFAIEGRLRTLPVTWQQSVDDYVEGLFSLSSHARERLGENAPKFESEVRALLSRYTAADSGVIEHSTFADILWGRVG